MTDPFRRVSDQVKRLNITGYLFPWVEGRPFLAQMTGSTDFFLLLFSTIDVLQDYMREAGLAYDSIKRIDDQTEFLGGIPYRDPEGARIRIAVDCRITPTGNTRFTEILREDA